ncbi:hypothetical protein FACS1894105_06770 [Clostridia bacterium]|nr:hypothetical protein FACS1894105_06770 [Clostridia bacterium]
MTKKQTIEKEIRAAEASLRMEGLRASKDARRECLLVLAGEMTDTQYIENVRRRYTEHNDAEAVHGKVQP